MTERGSAMFEWLLDVWYYAWELVAMVVDAVFFFWL